ncbi:MAG: transketolase [Chloroflexi bacterium]|nr:transketolase [Chloroflexota bacterium]
MDTVQQAKSGHPGMPMGAAAMGYVLWTRFLRHNPSNPHWPNRDRFVLSAGHGSALLYILLHLTGYDLPLEQLKRFRQWDSSTPGHPEYRRAPGVETTTGPLGQGFGNAVGMAMAQRFTAARFNRPGHAIVDHHIYTIASDGDFMEGVSSEAASLAGHLHLGNLICLYDDNHISIEGDTALAFTEDVGRRFEAYRWHVQQVEGNDLEAVARAIAAAQAETERPSLIVAHTHIAYGSPNFQDSAAAHGAPLGEEEVKRTKERFGFSPDQTFHLPPAALAHFRKAVARGTVLEQEWQQRLAAYRVAHPELAAQWDLHTRGELPAGWQAALPVFTPADGALATRTASGRVLNAIAPALPQLLGGSADLAPSTETYLKGLPDFGPQDYSGRNLHFGVREHSMGALLNGICLYGGLRPYGATFLIFSDYMRPPMRLAAMMELPVIYVFTHDSIGLGEDGPTHQPVEQLLALRAVPNLVVLRPADATETAEAWRIALERTEGPTALALSRQRLPVLDRSALAPAEGLARGGYVLSEAQGGTPQAIIIATGSEVHLALAAQAQLQAQGVAVRVVSMPSWELFDAQPHAYQDAVLPPGVRARVAAEAATTLGWSRYVGDAGAVVGIDHFGASAPAEVLYQQFGFTPEHVAQRVQDVLSPSTGSGQRRTGAPSG